MGGLHRSLKFWGAMALGLGIMAPTLALSLNGSVPAAEVGRAVPLVFLFGGIGMAFVAYGFAVLTRQYNHAGSAYALVGATLGPQAGFFSGFALLGYYVLSTICTVPASALFAEAFLNSVGVHHVPWLLLGIIAAAATAWLSTRDLRVAARTLLSLEGIGVFFIIVLTIVIFAKIGAGSAPTHQHFTLNVFALPAHTRLSAIGAATVFACLSWAGFEGIATLGEETTNPRRNIPRALLGAIGLSLPIFVIVMLAETLGFGTNHAGTAAFAGSATPLGDLANSFIGSWASSTLLFVAMASAFASLLGSCTAASRMGFAFSRDGFGPRTLSKLDDNGTPAVAAISVLALSVVITSIMAINGTSAVNDYFYYATIGVLCLLVAYGMVGISACFHIFRTRAWAVLVATPAALGTIFAGYIFYTEATGQSSPYNLFPYYAGAWCLIGLLIVLLRPQLAAQVGRQLAAELQPQAESTDLPIQMDQEVDDRSVQSERRPREVSDSVDGKDD